MESYGAFIHDNTIERYTVDIEAHTLLMETRPEGTADKQSVFLNFNGVLAHFFENVTGCNILFDVEEVAPEIFVANWHDFLVRNIPYGFPVLNFQYEYPLKSEDLERLPQVIKNNGYRIFVISASLGLTGFVIAKELNVETIKKGGV